MNVYSGVFVFVYHAEKGAKYLCFGNRNRKGIILPTEEHTLNLQLHYSSGEHLGIFVSCIALASSLLYSPSKTRTRNVHRTSNRILRHETSSYYRSI